MSARGPLIVRLCNWVGEATLALPALLLLERQGYALHLVGKKWAADLFAGHGWPVYVRPAKRSEAIAQLQQLRQQLSAIDAGFNRSPNMVLLTNSMSSALEARLGGLKPIGYSFDGRRLLLSHAVKHTPGQHAADDYWHISTSFVGVDLPRPPSLDLQTSAAQQKQARDLLSNHRINAGFVILCPLSGPADTTGKKIWPGFLELAQQLTKQGLQLVLCPGPGEEIEIRNDYPMATVLEAVNLGTYAALSTMAACTVANDTGPAHLAAAAGGKVISILGPDAAEKWRPIGPGVLVLHPTHGWPGSSDVLQAISKIIPGRN